MEHFEFVSTSDGQTYYLELAPDEDAEDVRAFSEHMGTMLCWHPRYMLGDQHFYNSPDEFWEEWGLTPGEETKSFKWLPLRLLDHSGLSISVDGTTYADPWDSGIVGLIYVTREKADKWGVPWDKVEEVLTNEVKEYDDYLIYGAQWAGVYSIDPNYSIDDVYGDYSRQAVMTEVDSCSGFYGYNDPDECKNATGILECMGWDVSSIKHLK